MPASNPARDDVRQTNFGYDVVPHYICDNLQEISAAQAPGSYPFDVIIDAGMYRDERPTYPGDVERPAGQRLSEPAPADGSYRAAGAQFSLSRAIRNLYVKNLP